MPWDKERYSNDPAYRANHVEFNARRRLRRATDPKFADAERDCKLRHAYGITLEDYVAMAKRQDGLCGLCRRRPTERLCVDHCHDTRMVRLLLCHTCNRGFGSFGHNPDLMRAGADYLEIWRIIHARKLAAGFKPIPIKTSKPKKRKDTKCRPTSPPTKNLKPHD